MEAVFEYLKILTVILECTFRYHYLYTYVVKSVTKSIFGAAL